jgi:hypothetical protein
MPTAMGQSFIMTPYYDKTNDMEESEAGKQLYLKEN